MTGFGAHTARPSVLTSARTVRVTFGEADGRVAVPRWDRDAPGTVSVYPRRASPALEDVDAGRFVHVSVNGHGPCRRGEGADSPAARRCEFACAVRRTRSRS
jgi:hypothetical protein